MKLSSINECCLINELIVYEQEIINYFKLLEEAEAVAQAPGINLKTIRGAIKNLKKNGKEAVSGAVQQYGSGYDSVVDYLAEKSILRKLPGSANLKKRLLVRLLKENFLVVG
jgi:hypothetical protein